MDASADRLEKLPKLEALGERPYAPGTRFGDRLTVAEVGARHDPDAATPASVCIAGRVTAFRNMGRSAFLDVRDGTGRLQVYAQRNELPEGRYASLLPLLDLGDFVAVRGTYGRTRKGEETVFAEDLELLTKALVAPPKEYFGLKDVEQRYRRRYVDLAVNEESSARFAARSRIVSALRRELEARGFLEVETPILHPIAGGAAARPFRTHHNALDLTLTLRIAPELHLKRLLVGGFERVFEIGRNFRNEGLSPRHNPEFTMLEAYWAYARAGDWMDALEAMLPRLVEEHAPARVDGARLRRGEQVIDLSAPFARRGYASLLEEHAGADPFDPDAVRAALARHRVPVEPDATHAKRVDALFDACVEDRLVAPTLVTDFPAEMSPLAKVSPDDPRVAERFELFVAGMEVANGFSELNDPAEQLRRFERQVASRDPELPGEVDHDYVEALAHGMPPAAGIGIGVDRLVMLLTDAASIRDVILFPLLRPLPARAADAAQLEGA